jgi:hypothetical protein
MYFLKKTYIGRDDFVSTSVPTVKSERVKYVVEDIGYWRKANAIHLWFVKNVQNGVDDCGEYYVSKDQLQDLLDTVNTVLESVKVKDGQIHNGTRYAEGKVEELYEPGKVITNPEVADRLLPTGNGFFFGGTDYDHYYLEDLKYTKLILEEVLKEMEDPKDYSSYYYRASW